MHPTTSDHNLELINACKSRNIEAVQRALDNGADVNFLFQEGGGEDLVLSPLVIACKNEDINIVNLLLTRENIEINRDDDSMDFPIMYAVKNGNIEITDILLKKGANINYSRWAFSETPLLEAAKANNEDMFKFLVNKGADLDQALEQKDNFAIGAEMKGEMSRVHEVAKLVRKNGTEPKSVVQILHDRELGKNR